MSALFPILLDRANRWRHGDFPHEKFPAIGEILAWATEPEGAGFRMRAPQVRAMEVYWFLRLVKGTPKIFDLYEKYFSRCRRPRRAAQGARHSRRRFQRVEIPMAGALAKHRRQRRLRARAQPRSSPRDDGPRISQLHSRPRNGCGKDRSHRRDHRHRVCDGPRISRRPFRAERPGFRAGHHHPRLAPRLAASPTTAFFRRACSSNSPPPSSSFSPATASAIFPSSKATHSTSSSPTPRKSASKRRPSARATSAIPRKADEARTELANLRLESIATLPQALDTELKKARKTVSYLHHNSAISGHGLICVVNTTGTPYFKKQSLRDVVNWYGLSQGIADNILKSVAGNIQAYDFDGDARHVVAQVVADFFGKYRDVKLPDGSPAKLAIYFPQSDDLRELRPVVETKLIDSASPPTSCSNATAIPARRKKTPLSASTTLHRDWSLSELFPPKRFGNADQIRANLHPLKPLIDT